MGMIEDDIRRLYEESRQRQAACQHRWEQTFFGQKYWVPGTWQYTCARCSKMSMIILETSE